MERFMALLVRNSSIHEEALHFNISPVFYKKKKKEAFTPMTLGCPAGHTACIVKIYLLH